mmetsp:Transcript_20231/g.65171  ORF Transcript_20231/g.65171 Transcript_20231/m.65171 type:complete len:214 (+) Transcript_20231:152-793(+)
MSHSAGDNDPRTSGTPMPRNVRCHLSPVLSFKKSAKLSYFTSSMPHLSASSSRRCLGASHSGESTANASFDVASSRSWNQYRRPKDESDDDFVVVTPSSFSGALCLLLEAPSSSSSTSFRLMSSSSQRVSGTRRLFRVSSSSLARPVRASSTSSSSTSARHQPWCFRDGRPFVSRRAARLAASTVVATKTPPGLRRPATSAKKVSARCRVSKQ